MELYEAIEKRHSVRKYRDLEVEEDKLNRVLAAGRAAPSAKNRQNWKFVVVRDPSTRAALSKAAEQPWMSSAPVIIAVVGTGNQVMYCGIPADPVDCAIAIDHMTLAAVAERLGTCWIGHFKQDECRKLLGVPKSYNIVEMFTLGYPADDGDARLDRKPLKEIVCFEKFSE